MTAPPTTELLRRWIGGDASALDALLPLVYDELRRVASRHLRRERSDHTLQTTALINEACLRLVEHNPQPAFTHSHFVALTSNLMRQILVDHARQRLAQKREGGCRITLAEDVASADPAEVDILAVDEALLRLARFDAQPARIVELRYFGGLSIEETCTALGVSAATLKRDWAMARAWLHREMHP